MAARLESDVLLAACLDLAGSVGRHSDLVSKGELSGDNGTASVPKKEILVGAKTWHQNRGAKKTRRRRSASVLVK